MELKKTLCDLFYDQVHVAGRRVAVHHLGEDFTYEQIAYEADCVAAWLRRNGLERGDRVAMLMPNSAKYVSCYLGILRAGGIVVALNPDTTARELSSTLGDAAPTAVFLSSSSSAKFQQWLYESTRAGTLGQLRLLVQVDDVAIQPYPEDWPVASLCDVLRCNPSCAVPGPGLDDLAQVIYTSGTTGCPKGVTISHRNLAANCSSIVQYLELSQDDSVFAVLPFFYSYGNSLLFTHLAVGGRLVLASNFVFLNQALQLMEAQRTSGFAGVPSTYSMLLHKSDFRKRRFPDLRYMTCAGGGLAPAVVSQLREILPHVQPFLMYGQTEATARLSTLLPEECSCKSGSIGRGIPGVTLKVLDDEGRPVPPGKTGEIVAQGDNIMHGYWNDPLETSRVLRAEGLRTGDLARVDEDGYIYIVGRKSDIIKSGAYRINPKEIEDLILELEAVAEVAVVGLPHDMWGEVPVAFVVPSPLADDLDAEQVEEYCRHSLPRYKQIREVRLVDRLPRTSNGKINRADLRNNRPRAPSGLAIQDARNRRVPSPLGIPATELKDSQDQDRVSPPTGHPGHSGKVSSGREAPLDDPTLVERCLAGEERAWEQMYLRFHPRLLRAVEFLLQPEAGKSELFDEIAARVWYTLVRDDCRLLAGFDVTRGCPFDVFLTGLARVEVLRYMRAERRRQSHERLGGRKKLQHGQVPELQVDSMMKEFLATLAPRERQFVKDYLVGHPETVNSPKVSQLSATNIWQRRHRIRRKLNRFLESE